MATKRKLKSKRAFLEPASYSNSFYDLTVDPAGYVTLTLHDCDRKITWYFSKPGEDRGKKKIAAFKKVVDDIYNHLHEVEK